MFRELDLFPSSGDRWKISTLLIPSGRTNFNHSIQQSTEYVPPIPHLSTEVDPLSKTLCSLEHRTMDKVQKPSNSECYTLVKTLYNRFNFSFILFQKF
jgi:hypothetical protein